MAVDLTELKQRLLAVTADPTGETAALRARFAAAQSRWHGLVGVDESAAAKAHIEVKQLAHQMRQDLAARRARAATAAAEVARIVSAELQRDPRPGAEKEILDSIEVSISEGRSDLDDQAWRRKPVPPVRE